MPGGLACKVQRAAQRLGDVRLTTTFSNIKRGDGLGDALGPRVADPCGSCPESQLSSLDLGTQAGTENVSLRLQLSSGVGAATP